MGSDATRRTSLYLESEAGKQDLKLRPHIERIIAGLVLHNGARRATGVGLRNADYQLRMAAVAYNPSAPLRTSSQTLGCVDQRTRKEETTSGQAVGR